MLFPQANEIDCTHRDLLLPKMVEPPPNSFGSRLLEDDSWDEESFRVLLAEMAPYKLPSE